LKKHFIKLKKWNQKARMTNNKKKILVLASTFPTFTKGDPTATFVHELSKRLLKQFDVYILAPYSFGAKSYQEKDNLKIYRFKYWFGRNNLADGAILPNLKRRKLLYFQIPFFIIFQILAIKKLQKKYDFDIIHAHWIIPQGLAATLFKDLSKWKGSVICTIHGGDIFGLQFLNRLKKWIIKKSTKVTVVSEAIKKEVLKLGVKNTTVEVIPMGVDVEKFNALKKDITLKERYNIEGTFLLFVGRLSEKKGIEYLLKAMPKIIDYAPNSKLLIVGAGELEKALKNKVYKQLNIYDNVIFTGGIPNSDLPKYYATADIFIGPSVVSENGDREGFPVSFMEAMACNTPLVISDIEVFDPLINEENVLKAKEKSSVEISKNIIRLIKDVNLQQRMIQNNIKLVDNTFSAEVVGNRYISVLSNN